MFVVCFLVISKYSNHDDFKSFVFIGVLSRSFDSDPMNFDGRIEIYSRAFLLTELLNVCLSTESLNRPFRDRVHVL